MSSYWKTPNNISLEMVNINAGDMNIVVRWQQKDFADIVCGSFCK